MASESETTLLPCPFCGREPAFVPYKRDGLTLKCPSFGCVKFSQRAMRFDLEWLRGKMTESWNRRATSAKAKDSTHTGTVADIADSELLRRAISSLAAKARKQPAWARISDVFALGSTYSAQLCRRFGRDPGTGKELVAAIAQQT